MPLRNHIPALLLLPFILIGCAKPASNPYRDEIVNANSWYPVAYGDDQLVYYYAPFATTYEADGLITTLISKSKGQAAAKILPSRWEINCFDKTVRINGIDSNGSWKLGKDWEQVGEKTVGQNLVRNLCLKSAAGRDDLQFLAMGYVNKSNSYESFFLAQNESLSGANSSTKAFEILYLKSQNNSWSRFILTIDCANRHYSTSSDPNSKNLQWNISSTGSAAELMTIKACGSPRADSDAANKQNQQNYVNTKRMPKAQVGIASPAPQPLDKNGPVIRTVQVNFDSTPNGATVKDVKTGHTIGVTPFVVKYNLDVSKLKAGRCSEISALSFEWVSGAKARTSSPQKVCMYADDLFSISMQRPKSPGLQLDIDYQVKLQQLKTQQEALVAQQRQAAAAEQQARAQQAKAAAEAEQAKSAQDALLLQMFQGGSMINKSPTRLPVNCSPTVGGGYSCY